MDNYILCGMQFGDEGKGTFVDYLTHKENVSQIVRYNGGSQASHTVITPNGIIHKFSQLGSGMFYENCHTILDQNMVINLENLVVEMQIFSEKTGIPFSELRDRMHIHKDCFVVTPYHKLSNKLRELSMGTSRRGSVGTGVSEVMYLQSLPKKSPSSPTLALTVGDIFGTNSAEKILIVFQALHEYVSHFYHKHKKTILKNVPEEMKVSLLNEIAFLLNKDSPYIIASKYIHDFKHAPSDVNFKPCIYSYDSNNFVSKNTSSVIYEGAQGLLIDWEKGIKPNTTHLDTTNEFANYLCNGLPNVHNIGIAKAFFSRHGMGVFPTEDISLNQRISDKNQEQSFWNGSIRFGWFDIVLIRYAQMINQVDELYLSSLDKLSSFEKIKICIAYLYFGEMDNTFKKIFEYTVNPNGTILIKNIKKSDPDLGKYLKQCSPYYIVVDGWKTDISSIKNKDELPDNCLKYIRLLENLCNIPISVVSVGPTRENKIQLL